MTQGKKPVAPPPRIYEAVPYVFTPSELLVLGAELAREAQIITDLHQKQKVVAAQYKSAIAEAEGRAAQFVRKLNEKSELRDAECVVRMHSPAVGQKSLVRLDTGEVLREERMTAAERQEQLPFEEARKEDDESQPYKRRDPKVN